jgi:hypothetical protein
VEVVRFEGATSQNTAYFTCDHAEWRINWSYTVIPETGQYAGFAVTPCTNESHLIGSVNGCILQMGNTSMEGLTYLHNRNGTFYLAISVANVQGYSIVIEQDVESVPEFSAYMMILVMAAGVVIAYAVRRHR